MNRICLITILVICSCTGGNIPNKTELVRAFKELIPEKNYDDKKFILVIPGAGCTGCIGQATVTVRDQLSEMSTGVVVFTKIVDKKILKSQLGREVYDHKNVHFDVHGILSTPQLETIYPMLYTLENGEITSAEVFEVSIQLDPFIKTSTF